MCRHRLSPAKDLIIYPQCSLHDINLSYIAFLSTVSVNAESWERRILRRSLLKLFSGQQILLYCSVHIGQPEIATLKAIGQALMIKAELMQ